MIRCILLLVALATGLAASAAAQETPPRPEDVATLDGIIKAYYEVVSGPAGQARDWARDRTLHHPKAHITIVGQGSDGQPVARVMTLAEYHERSGNLAQTGFFEEEVHRVTQRLGNTVHIWSTYAWRRSADGPVAGRGINSIQLFWADGRWWITAWMFDNTGAEVPTEYLPGGRPR